MKQQRKVHKSSGFTLIELMIAIAIMGIIGAIAVPSYLEQIRESRRMDAKNELLKLKMQQETFRLENNSFATTTQLAPVATEFYTFTVEDVTATTYTLVAKAKGSQTKDSACATLKLNQSMDKTPTQCW